MKSSRKVVKSLEITTRNQGPDLLIKYHIEPLTGNKKTGCCRVRCARATTVAPRCACDSLCQPMANAENFSSIPEHLLRNPNLVCFSLQRSLFLPSALKLLQPVRLRHCVVQPQMRVGVHRHTDVAVTHQVLQGLRIHTRLRLVTAVL